MVFVSVRRFAVPWLQRQRLQWLLAMSAWSLCWALGKPFSYSPQAVGLGLGNRPHSAYHGPIMSAYRLLALLLALLFAACATTAPEVTRQPMPELFEDAAFVAPHKPPDAKAVFALSPAMLQYLERDIAAAIRRLGPKHALVDALHTKAQLRLEYDAERTRTAAEAFEVRAGNCLSLVVMTAALAKHLQLPIRFQALTGVEVWSRSGDLSFVNGHVNITVAQRLVDRFDAAYGDAPVRFDFGPVPLGRNQALRVISEARILSMFMNNRAAEYLVRGEFADAYAHAREAVIQDPSHASAYNTLGVIYQRHGLGSAAERAYRQAVARDDKHKAALQNLVRQLNQQGRGVEAASFQQRLLALEPELPFVHFDQGVAAAKAGQYASAREHLLREMKRDPDYHEFHFWLAVSLYGLGDVRQARRHLELAERNSLTVRERDIYASKLRKLEPAAVGSTRSN
jgi:Tfp pilus assembly protein PilF